METSPLKITHAVPEDVQKVLDAMTEENWLQGGYENDGRMCFTQRAWSMAGGARKGNWTDVQRRCLVRYGTSASIVNDEATSLSDFKSKIIALYEVKP